MTVHSREIDTPAVEESAPPSLELREDRSGDGPEAATGNRKPPAETGREKLVSSLRRWIRPALFSLVPLALVGGVYVYATGGATLSTDDAYVNARQVGISTDVAGLVSEVDVHDNQRVSAGQVLYRLDPRQFQIALDNAKSNLAQTALSLQSMKADYQQMLASTAAQNAQVKLDEANFKRDSSLLAAGAVAKAEYDLTQFTLETDISKRDALQQQSVSELVKLGGNADTPVEQLPQYLQAKAQLREAQRQLDHTVVRAPFSGTVTNVPSIAPGKYLAASTVAFYLVDAQHLWIDATPKETELTYVRPGQKATITVDAYPDLVWHGTVTSLSPAAAQQFSLLPAQNTSGNWVKVVQRVPLRVSVDPGTDAMPALRSGMSVEVNIDTGHVRGLSIF